MAKPEKDKEAAYKAWKAHSKLSEEEVHFFSEYSANLYNYFTCQPDSEVLKPGLLMDLDR